MAYSRGKRYGEVQGSPPVCRCGCEVVLGIIWTVYNSERRFYGCPRYKRNERDGCGFIHWIDPPSGERHNCDNRLFKRVDEIEGNLLQQQIFVEKRDEQVGKILMLMEDVKTGLCIFVVLLYFVLYLALW
ncbi:uncharacterized protein LOC133825104 [Humulus lupulus]|uniref:uncharacterized protein LOC133825104 n=1 Tax=Humulus lupulus TaxID=3486 RepID=UPI002B40138B|nr:uncharacterized protein LOC133825104 [Humulus lupulus]